LKGDITKNFGTVRDSKLISFKFFMKLQLLLHRKHSQSVLMPLIWDAYKTHKYVGFIAKADLTHNNHSHC
jgi:fibrillarin-like rRNA methylase